MKKIVILLSLVVILTSCSVFHKNTNASKIKQITNTIQHDKVELASNATNKLKEISILATGIDFALSRITNYSADITTARSFNDRIIDLSGPTSLLETTKIQKTVTELGSSSQSDQKKGEDDLKLHDKIIENLQKQALQLNQQIETQNKKITELATKTAQKADELDSWFGLGAIFYGIKHFVLSCLTWIIIVIISFLVLRIISGRSLICKIFFSIFEALGGMFIHLIRLILPNAHKHANLVDSKSE